MMVTNTIPTIAIVDLHFEKNSKQCKSNFNIHIIQKNILSLKVENFLIKM
jgi:hypothetical protein